MNPFEASGEVGNAVEENDFSYLESIAALIWVQDSPESLIPTIRSLVTAAPGIQIFIGGPSDYEILCKLFESLVGDSRTLFSVDGTLSSAIKLCSLEFTRHVLVISAPIVMPPKALERAINALNDDLRLASVSFLSNAAGAFSVPHRNTPVFHQVGVHDEISITRLLRTLLPAPTMVHVAAPTGAAVVLSRFALGALGGMNPEISGTAEFQVASASLSAAQRGFLNSLDSGTYITRAFDLGAYHSNPIDDQTSTEWGHLAHSFPNSVNQYHRDAGSNDSTTAIALMTAAAKIRGLRVIIDARDLGPKEMGTQVQILSLIRDLAARSDVASVQVGIPGATPAYASQYLSSEKIRLFASPTGDLAEAEPADIIHRPSQPSSTLPFEAWRSKVSRVIVTLQDLIAYQVGSYHANGDLWNRYRHDLLEGASGADGVISISQETVRQIRAEQLPIDPSRIFVVPNGTDHFSGDERESFPSELGARGFIEQEFLLVLGANYGHKNRDLAIRAWKMLRLTYPNLALVLAGAYVPTGSSRINEALAIGSDSTGLFVLPDVTSTERNWLLRHARTVLYPTSAEGFGLVPFEAARFGTPTVGVSFAPLNEFNDQPVWATGWTDIEISTAVGKLMESPQTCEDQVLATLRNSTNLSWADTAAGLVDVYRTVLSIPATSRPHKG